MKSSQSLTNSFFNINSLKEYKNILKNGGIFAYPTDTVWGIGCLADNEIGIKKIYEIKNREKNKPLILLGSKIEDFLPYIESWPIEAKSLATQYWPGALTIIVKKAKQTPDFITSGLDTIGLRIPNHPVLQEFLSHTGVIASTSANLSGEKPSTTFEETQKSIGSSMDFIIKDGGILAKGIASTIVLIENNNYKVLREGNIKIS